jgi:hypothetical protein
MQRRFFYALLVSAALLLQAATVTFAFEATAHSSGACARDQIAFGVSGGAAEDGGAGHAKDHSRACNHCGWCAAGSPLPATTTIAASGATEFFKQTIHIDHFEPRTGARIDPNASPRAPPSLS